MSLTLRFVGARLRAIKGCRPAPSPASRLLHFGSTSPMTLSRFFPLLALGLATLARAAVSDAEAARLGQDLTPLGAEKAGNADGSIPAWTGGITTPPAGYKPGDHHPDPFANDQPLYTITAANLGQHESKLTPGQL